MEQIKVLCEQEECRVLGLSQEGALWTRLYNIKAQKKISVSIVDLVHDFNNEHIFTTLYNSGVYCYKWMLEYGCTLHMTFHRLMFNNYEKMRGTVIMGINTTCKIVGIGLV